MLKQKKALNKSMGILFSIFTILFAFCNESIAQIHVDYPFKAISDPIGNIYITGNLYNGNTGTQDIFLTKITTNSSTTVIYPNAYGDDNGYSLALDNNGDIIITGYIENQATDSKDIIVLKYRGNSINTLIWDKILAAPYEDMGLSVCIFDGNDIAICGYQTNTSTEKDFFIYAMDEDNGYIHEDVIVFSDYDDVATSILSDDGYVYIVGYFQNEGTSEVDTKSIAYSRADWDTLAENITLGEKNSDRPTSFTITEYAKGEAVKSKRAITVLYESIGNTNSNTYHLDGNTPNQPIMWLQAYDNSTVDVPTCVASDEDYVYTIGYTNNLLTAYDYFIQKFDKSSGSIISPFPATYDYNFSQQNDKPSSVVSDEDFLYITGYNDAADAEYTLGAFEKDPSSYTLGDNGPAWVQSYTPAIEGMDMSGMEKYTYCTFDRESNITMIVFGYNDSISFIAGQTYSKEGRIVSTISPEIIQRKNWITKTNEKPEQIKANNYPNPFNPVTNINFTIPASGFVEISIYDINGRRVETLLKQNLNSGNHIVKWNAFSYASGVYFYSIKTQNQTITKKLLLVK